MSSYQDQRYSLLGQKPLPYSVNSRSASLILLPPRGKELEDGGFAPSLDISIHKGPFENASYCVWSKKRRRVFQRSLSGCEWADAQGKSIRFLTLTSSPISPNIRDSYRKFVKRIRRKHGEFEYLAIKEFTKSGLAHLHILYRGPYLEQAWISEQWQAIHQAKIVYIETVRGSHTQVANYLAKYMGKEGSSRYWMSGSWVYRGFVKDWKQICYKNDYNMDASKEEWRRHLINRALNQGVQVTLMEGG